MREAARNKRKSLEKRVIAPARRASLVEETKGPGIEKK